MYSPPEVQSGCGQSSPFREAHPPFIIARSVAFIGDRETSLRSRLTRIREQRHTKRRRFKQTSSLEQRLAGEASRLREAARTIPSGFGRKALLRRARQGEIAAHLTKWLISPGLSRQSEELDR